MQIILNEYAYMALASPQVVDKTKFERSGSLEYYHIS